MIWPADRVEPNGGFTTVLGVEGTMKPQGIPQRSYSGHANRVGRRGEARVPVAVAVVVAAGLYALLPESLLLGPRLLIPLLEAALLVAVLLVRPRRMTAETRLSRVVSMSLAVVIAVTNIAALGFLVAQLVKNKDAEGGALLLAALQVWATNVIAFGLIYWELDRGGPVARRKLRGATCRWPTSGSPRTRTTDAVVEVAAGRAIADWVPTLLDYLYVSTTNSARSARPTPCR